MFRGFRIRNAREGSILGQRFPRQRCVTRGTAAYPEGENMYQDQQFGGEHGFDQLPHDPELVQLDANFGQVAGQFGYEDPGQFGADPEQFGAVGGGGGSDPTAALTAAGGLASSLLGAGGIPGLITALREPEGAQAAGNIASLETQIATLLAAGRETEATALQIEQQGEIQRLRDLAAKEETPWYKHPAAIIGFTVLGIGTVYGVARVAMNAGARNQHQLASGW